MCLLQRFVQFAGVFATCLGHICSATTPTTHNSRNRLDQIPRVDSLGQVVSYGSDELGLGIVDCTEHDHTLLLLVAEPIRHFAQCVRRRRLDLGDQHRNVVDLLDLFQQALEVEPGKVAAQAAIFLPRLGNLLTQRIDASRNLIGSRTKLAGCAPHGIDLAAR